MASREKSDAEAAPSGPKRFYREAGIEREADGRLSVRLDGKPVRTPGKAQLTLPNAKLAEAAAGEWSQQGERIDPGAMPLTRLANSVIDGVAGNKSAVVDDVLSYAGSDLLCYRATSPVGLVAAQSRHWDPIIGWAKEALNAPLTLAEGLMPIEQPAASLAEIRKRVAELDAWRLAALHVMTALLGSALLALAVALGRLSAEEAWVAAHVDEDWQIGLWGEDQEAKERRKNRFRDYAAAATMLELLDRGEGPNPCGEGDCQER
jgi:chaperone required for assembly of F1-ATPase